MKKSLAFKNRILHQFDHFCDKKGQVYKYLLPDELNK